MASKAAPKVDQFKLGPWTFTSSKSHILVSGGPRREQFEASLRLPQLPEMIFDKNILRVEHQSGFGMEFNALDALKRVDPEHDLMKVAVAQQWAESRSDCEHIKDVIKPFDWTYTTDYQGTLFGTEGNEIKCFASDERIDIEKLKVKEQILYYADLLLFEDELADNGSSTLNVKMRVMSSGFFILLRFYLRVDNVLIRLCDTRIHHEFDKCHFLREYTVKEILFKDLPVPHQLYNDPNEIAPYLKLKEERYERLQLPQSHMQYLYPDMDLAPR
ncbi:TIP41-like protein [Lineus longissimus]|uniref:TIP41-like protein n=1 Tax=Lineus longissimus TaxID=88925 RepID=UPI002B4F7503